MSTVDYSHSCVVLVQYKVLSDKTISLSADDFEIQVPPDGFDANGSPVDIRERYKAPQITPGRPVKVRVYNVSVADAVSRFPKVNVSKLDRDNILKRCKEALERSEYGYTVIR